MATLNSQDYLRVTFVCKAGEQLGLNVRHFQYIKTEGDPPPDQQVADAISGYYAERYLDLLPAIDTEYRGVILARETPSPTAQIYSNVEQAAGGNEQEDVLPRQVAGIITLRTGLPGPGGRGRVYVPFPYRTADSTSTYNPTGAYVAKLQALANLFSGDETVPNGMDPFVLTNVLKTKKTGQIVYLPIVSSLARGYWASQRRRGTLGAANQDFIPDV